jgi:hypothetical protein
LGNRFGRILIFYLILSLPSIYFDVEVCQQAKVSHRGYVGRCTSWRIFNETMLQRKLCSQQVMHAFGCVSKSLFGSWAARYCQPTGSDVSSSEFEDFVRVLREATKDYRQSTQESRQRMLDHLIQRFAEKRFQRGSRWHYVYDLLSPKPGSQGIVKVCRNAFMAIFGVTSYQIEYAQEQVVAGVVARQGVHAPHYNITKKAAFEAFGLDVDRYHAALNNFVDFDRVAETEGNLVATAYLSDWLDICTEFQPMINRVTVPMDVDESSGGEKASETGSESGEESNDNSSDDESESSDAADGRENVHPVTAPSVAPSKNSAVAAMHSGVSGRRVQSRTADWMCMCGCGGKFTSMQSHLRVKCKGNCGKWINKECSPRSWRCPECHMSSVYNDASDSTADSD